ncbi:MAG: DUF448 domain-containing protein [Desulfuromonadales bacterium]|nr:DUF448 domain-containing protein [Desulfuromonadales bacterium]
MTQPRRQPQRTCLGCRQTFDQMALLRYVRSPQGEVVADFRHRLPGRGAYTCWSRSCLEQAVRKRQFDRAFRQPCPAVQLDGLLAETLAALTTRLLGLVGMARKSSQIVTGSNAVFAALQRRQALTLLVVAEDVSAGIEEKVRGKAARDQLAICKLFRKAELGRVTGRAETSVLGLLKGQLAETFAAELRKYRNVSGEV